MKLSEDPSPKAPATKQDIESLGDKLVWPPAFTRDIRLKKMQNLLKKEDDVMRDPSLTDTEKVLRVAEYKQKYNVQDKELFEPERLAAVPSQPLPPLTSKIKAEKPNQDTDSDVSDTSDVTVIDQSDYDDLSDDDVDGQTDYLAEDLLQMVPPHRKAKTTVMLKKLAADGKLNWNNQGKVYYRGKKIPGSNIGHLVQYFQTAHKKNPLPQPHGAGIFAQALRKAQAFDDVLLGGQEDDNVRQIFKGHSPKTPGFHLSKFGSVKGTKFTKSRQQSRGSPLSSPSLSRPLKRRREEDIKTVTNLEY